MRTIPSLASVLTLCHRRADPSSAGRCGRAAGAYVAGYLWLGNVEFTRGADGTPVTRRMYRHWFMSAAFRPARWIEAKWTRHEVIVDSYLPLRWNR
jgi:hypothetical protein